MPHGQLPPQSVRIVQVFNCHDNNHRTRIVDVYDQLFAVSLYPEKSSIVRSSPMTILAHSLPRIHQDTALHLAAMSVYLTARPYMGFTW
jgi:hypothetical protein